MAMRLERTHAEVVGAPAGVVVGGVCGLVPRRIAPHCDVTEEPHRLRLAAMVLGLAGRRTAPHARLPRDPEEVRRRPPENLDPVLVAKPGNRHDVVDGGGVPRERVIGPEDHVLDPRLGDKVPHALAREHDRIEIQLSASEIFRRLLLR